MPKKYQDMTREQLLEAIVELEKAKPKISKKTIEKERKKAEEERMAREAEAVSVGKCDYLPALCPVWAGLPMTKLVGLEHFTPASFLLRHPAGACCRPREEAHQGRASCSKNCPAAVRHGRLSQGL